MLFDVSWNTSPTVNATGYFSLSFPKFSKVIAAVVSFDNSTNLTGDMSSTIDISYAWGSQASKDYNVDVYPVVSKGGGDRVAGTTATCSGKKFVCIAAGQ